MKLTIVGSCAVSAALVFLLGCERPEPNAPESSATSGEQSALLKTSAGVTESAPPAGCVKMLGVVNTRLKMAAKHFRVAKMEYVTAPGSGQYGSTVFAKDIGNKQLAYHYVNALLLSPGEFTYVVDETEGVATGGLTNDDTEPAIDRAMQTWDAVTGSGLSITKFNYPGHDLGVIQWSLGMGGSGSYVAEVTHAGWVSPAFFDSIAPPNGSTSILGVTFTFIWVDDDGNPIDTNGDHKFDAAFREIYYNNGFSWTTEVVSFTSPLTDVESIALHESGHGLSQAHFGTIFFDGRGTVDPSLQHLHFAPRAVMNAIYWDTQRSLLGTDIAGHLSIWATWPLR